MTPNEKAILNKYWFLVIYRSLANDTPTKLPMIALAYSIWKNKFKGEPAIKKMKLEKLILEGKITVEKL